MKICLVTAFPPGRGGLSEYGFHIASELQRNSNISLTVLADTLEDTQPEPEGFTVSRCWSFNDPKSMTTLWAAIRREKPDVVWFNLIFSTFGRNPLAAFCGLALPLLTRLSGFYTHVTLHHLMDTIDLNDAGVRYPRLYQFAGTVATKLLLKSNSLSVLVSAHRKVLQEKYGSRNVHFRAHGIFTQYPERPDYSRRGNPYHRILAFGKWGTYKKLEPICEAFHLVAKRIPNVKLVIAGGNHPGAPGYVESIAKKFANEPRIEFTGYVAESDIPNLFQSSSVAVMPYSSATGSSGVAHLACTYGVPIVSTDIAEFHAMADEEDLAMEFCEVGNTADLANRLIELFESPERQEAMAEQNFAAAVRMTMPRIANRYLRHFDLEQKTRALKAIQRFRRLPRWLHSGVFANMSAAWNFSATNSLMQSLPSGRESMDLSHGFGSGRVSGAVVSIDQNRGYESGWPNAAVAGMEHDTQHGNAEPIPLFTITDGDAAA